MSFLTIPIEIILQIADILPASDLSTLSRTNSTLSQLLTPVLLRLAEHSDMERCLFLDRPASLRAILCPANKHLNIDYLIRVPGDRIHSWPLHYAAQHGSPALVATIISLGVPVDEPLRDGIQYRITTLQRAVLGGNPTNVSHVLDAGADINRTSDHNRCTPFVLACMNGFEPVANLLIDRGARLGAHELVSAAHRGMTGVLERVLDSGIPVDILFHSTCAGQHITALQFVCMYGSGAAEVLLRRGADVNAGMGGMWLPLYSCVMTKNIVFARLLIDHGAQRDGLLGEGKTLAAVAVAAMSGNMAMVECLASYRR